MSPSTPAARHRVAALAGLGGSLLLTGALAALTALQYPFLRSLGWHPLEAPTTDWPSGLALGPLGGWMTATFLASGLLLATFARGLRECLRDSAAGRSGALLLGLAGAALAALSAPADPTYRAGPATILGRAHDIAYVALGLTFLPALLLLARAFGRDRRWRGYGLLTALLAVTGAPAFALKGALFYVPLVGALLWCAAVAGRLWQLGKREDSREGEALP